MRRPKLHNGLRHTIRHLKFFKNFWKRRSRELVRTVAELKEENRLLSMTAIELFDQCKQLKQQLKDMEATR